MAKLFERADTAQIIQTTPEHRQIAKVLEFPAWVAAYVNWESIGQEARELGSHFEVRNHTDGALTITFFWSYAPEEL